MTLENLKRRIVATVDATQDETLLQDVMKLLLKQKTIVDDKDLTKLCMTASEKSLSEAWDNEDDERWNAFLKN